MKSQRFDIAIIGAGSGGMAAARRAIAAGQSVVLFEGRHVGGTCVNAGCVPKKLMVQASRYDDAFRQSGGFGWSPGEAAFDWDRLRDRVDHEVRRLSALHRDRLRDGGTVIVPQRAMLDGPGRVRTDDGGVYHAKNIILASGARSRIPPIAGTELCLTSDDIFHLPRLPERMAIIGGGYIAVEFACMMQRFGVSVTLFEVGDRLISGFDHDIAARLETAMTDQGIEILKGTRIDGIERVADGLMAIADRSEHGPFGEVLLATSRMPNIQGLGLESCKIAPAKSGHIPVDETGRTSADNIFAIGDIAANMMLTPVAVRDGRCAIDTILGQSTESLPVGAVPTATFTTPECAGVGLTEPAARKAGLPIEVRTKCFNPLAAALSGTGENIFLKAIVAQDTGHLLGLHFFGPSAAEAVQLGAMALSADLTEQDMARTMPLHPSVAEEVLGLAIPDTPIHPSPDAQALAAAE